MSGTETRRSTRIVLQALLGAGLLFLFIWAGWYLNSPQFHERVRLKVILDLEQITGGRAELKAFRWKLSKLEFQAQDLTIHGLEGAGEASYLHADRLLVRLKIISLLERQIGLRYVEIDRPVIHLIVYPDGSTNQPVPRAGPANARTGVAPMFDLAIDRLDLRSGMLLVNNRQLPLDFSADDMTLSMALSQRESSYEGVVSVGPVDRLDVGGLSLKYDGLRAVRSSAKAQFTLRRNRVELRSLELSANGFSITASGELDNFADPRIQLQYHGNLDVAAVGEIAQDARLRAGRMVIDGQGSYRRGELASSGRLLLREVQYRDYPLAVSGLNGSASYSLSPDRLALSDVRGQVFGGSVTGNVEVLHWFSGSQAQRSITAIARSAIPPRGSARLRFENLQLSGIAAAISERALPLARIHPAGAATGTVNARWTGTPANAEAEIAFEVAPPPQPLTGQLPIAGSARMVYSAARGLMGIPQLELATRATRVAAAGTLGSTSARLNLSVNTTDLAEWQPVLSAFGQPAIPAELHGRAGFSGSVVGKIASPTISGHLQVTDFDYLRMNAAPARPQARPASMATSAAPPGPRRVHWDSVVVDLQYSPQAVSFEHGVLKRGDAQISFNGKAGLAQGSFTESSPLRAQVDVRNADLADAALLAGYEYPPAGKFSLSLNASGTRRDLRGAGRLQATNGTIFHEPFQSLRADVRLTGREIQLNHLAATHNGAVVQGFLAYDLGTRAFRLDLGGNSFELAKMPALQTERFSVAGQASFHLQGSGTEEAPVINADLHLHDLVLNGEPAGEFDATAVTRGSDMRLTARSHFQNAELAVDGDVRLRNDFPANITLRFAHLDIDPLIRAYVQGRITGHSQIGGTVQLTGPLRRARDLTIDGHVDQFSAEVEKVRLESDGPIHFGLKNELFTLDRLHLLGEGTDLVGSGTAELGGQRELNVHADGNLNLRLLRTVNRDLSADGATQIHAVVRGTMSRADVAGRVRVDNGNISYVDLPNGLSNINGTLVFNENRLQVQSLTAQTGGGTLSLGGFIAYSRGVNFNLTMTGKDIRLRYPAGVSSYADTNLRLVGSPQVSILSGDITVTKFGLNPEFDLGLYLARSRQPSAVPPADSPLNNLHFDVHIVSTPELQVQTSLGKVSGNADLRLRGTAARPVVLGRVDIAEGDVMFNGTKYHVERGEIAFKNPTRIEPVLNLDATARVRDYDITLGFHGPVDKLSMTYRSDPPLPSEDIIALLALGRTREDLGTYQPTSGQYATPESTSSAILGQALSSAMSGRMQKLFGIGRIKIDPQAGGPENNPNARVTIEQQVSDRVTLTFISNLAQSAQQIVQLEYQVNKRVSVIAVRDQNGVLAFDVKYRQRKR